jgi:hypothetical protein
LVAVRHAVRLALATGRYRERPDVRLAPPVGAGPCTPSFTVVAVPHRLVAMGSPTCGGQRRGPLGANSTRHVMRELRANGARHRGLFFP